MDSLAKRYADPFFLLDQMTGWGVLDEFVDKMYEQMDEDRYWDLYLRAIPFCQCSYEEFRSGKTSNGTQRTGTPFTDEDIEATIQRSQEILNGFVPED